MDFDFSDDQEQLRDAVRKWVDRAYDLPRRRAIEHDGGFSQGAWNEMAELGLCGLYVPTENDGMGMGAVEAMVALEELGRGIVLEPLSQSLIAGALLAQHGNDALRSTWLPRVASGEALVAFAWQERAGRYRTDVCTTTAQEAGGAWTLTGTKSVVPAGDHAQAFLVSAQAGGQPALFLVDRSAPGVTVRAYPTQDGGRAAEVVLAGAAAQLVTRAGQDAVEQGVDIGIASTCAYAMGAMDKTMAITAEYLNTRKQFGQTLASFQALRHRMADLKMQLELARSMSYYASLKLGAPAPERRMAMARAKYQVGVSMRAIGQQAVQLHGGIGVTCEYIVSHYFRALTQLEFAFGDTMHQLGEVSARMQDTAGVFA